MDKYSATWVSHSSIGDFLVCPRAYFLNNVYKDPITKRKISTITPHLALGQAVHNTLESLAREHMPADERKNVSMIDRFEAEWKNVSGIYGGFQDEADEERMKERGRGMIEYVQSEPGPLVRKTVLLPERSMVPHFYLSEEDNIILCGKVDWLEYIPETDSVKIIDFKTGKHKEKEHSLQLPIYVLLVSNVQSRQVSGAAYWYLEDGEHRGIEEVQLPTYDNAYARVYDAARRVQDARADQAYDCPQGAEGCRQCQPFEAILRGEATYVGVNDINQDVYVVGS